MSDPEAECVPCRRDEHTRCREDVHLYGLAVPCACWVHDHYGLTSAPDDYPPNDDRADAAQRRYERRIGW
jgi:hypothetical protein